MVPLWAWDEDEPRIRPDRSYFADSSVNDTYPANGALEWQRTLSQIVMSVLGSGMQIVRLEEYAEPFFRWGDLDAACWRGQLPNTFALLARRPA